MRSLATTLIALLVVASTVLAEPQPHYNEIALGTNTSGSATFNVRGYLDSIYVAVSDGASTGTVAVSYAPLVGGTSVNIATNSVTDEKVWRPVVDRTDINGDALTSDEPAPYVFVGETITFAVSSSPTNLTWKCLIVTKQN